MFKSLATLAFILFPACEVRSPEARGEVARPWKPPAPAKIIGVAADSVRRAIQKRLADAPPSSLNSDGWRHVRRLYQSNDSAALWLDARGLNRSRSKALITAFASTTDDALRLDTFPLVDVTRALTALRQSRRPTAEQLAEADVMLTALFAALAEDLLTGQIKPRSVLQSWYIDPQEERVDSILALTLAAQRPDQAIALLRPREPEYDALRRELARYRDLATRGEWQTVARGKALSPGDSAPATRLASLRERLSAEGLLDGRNARGAQPDSVTAVYDSVLAGAVAVFQARHGIVVDSILGAETVASLNVPVRYRLGQIAANLERIRWLPRALGSRYILVNVPAFRLQAFDGGKEALSMKVIVGSEYNGRATPVFSDSMQYVVFRPYWNVPDSIAAREIWPKEESSPGYFARNGYETFRSEGKQRVRQRPGPGNALGAVKFIFPNDFNIYLHDTSEPQLFDKDVRGFSHGCIRIERPAELAQWVLGWPADSVQRQMQEAGTEHRVNLPRKIPVYIVYLTTYVSDGQLYYANDLYDRDAAMVRAVQNGAVPHPEVEQAVETLRKLAG